MAEENLREIYRNLGYCFGKTDEEIRDQLRKDNGLPTVAPTGPFARLLFALRDINIISIETRLRYLESQGLVKSEERNGEVIYFKASGKTEQDFDYLPHVVRLVHA